MSLEVLREALLGIGRGERLGLATIVGTRGSTPQKVGARLLVGGGTRLAGTLGGGAVEADALRRAAAAAGGTPGQLREYSMATGTDEWGLACGGTMVVLLEAVGPEDRGWLGALVDSVDAGRPVALIAPVEGPAAGARFLVRAEGSGPAAAGLSPEAREAVAEVLARERGALLVGPAGGRVFVEAFAPRPALVVLGAGHVGQALARLGRFLGVHVTVADDRPEFATVERFPEADRVLAAPIPSVLARLPIAPGTAVVVAMRSHELDYEATAAALSTPARYVGLVGARRKAILVIERLVAEGVPAERARALRTPVGLDIGARTPEEIAVSILGEWLMVDRGGTGASLQLADELFAKATRGRDAAPAAP